MKGNFLERSLKVFNLSEVIEEIKSYESKGWKFELNPKTKKYFPRAISPKGEFWTATKIKQIKEKNSKLEGDSLDAYNYLKSYHSYFKSIQLPSRFLDKN
jgi:hypothetical protein